MEILAPSGVMRSNGKINLNANTTYDNTTIIGTDTNRFRENCDELLPTMMASSSKMV